MARTKEKLAMLYNLNMQTILREQVLLTVSFLFNTYHKVLVLLIQMIVMLMCEHGDSNIQDFSYDILRSDHYIHLPRYSLLADAKIKKFRFPRTYHFCS